MTTFLTHHNFAVFFGLLGNVVSFMVYLAPTLTFYKIYKVKSTQGFDPLPYAVALFSSMLTLYYGLIKQSNGTLLITINSVGIIIESVYLVIFMVYATKSAKWKTTKMLLTLNVGLLGIIVLLSSLLTHGAQREAMIGWICAICSVCFFASPLCVIRTVIKTKSVEFMPFGLSFSLTICAVMWFFYGFFIKDFFVALPNVLGLLFGMTQMTLYFIYKNSNKKIQETLPTTSAIPTKLEAEIRVSELVAVEIKPQVADPSKKLDNDDDNNNNNNNLVTKKDNPSVDVQQIALPEMDEQVIIKVPELLAIEVNGCGGVNATEALERQPVVICAAV